MILVLLQNSWNRSGTWKSREHWIRALMRSRSGKRLRIALRCVDDSKLHFDNTTWEVGTVSSSKLSPDRAHLRELFSKDWELVIVFGKQAEECALEMWKGSLLVAPHPCFRFATNELFQDAIPAAIDALQSGAFGRARVSQEVGRCTFRKLNE